MMGANLPKSCPGATMSQFIVMTASGYEALWVKWGGNSNILQEWRACSHLLRCCILSLFKPGRRGSNMQHGQVNERVGARACFNKIVVKTSQPLIITPYRNWNSVFFQICFSAIFLSQYTHHQAHFAQLQAHCGRIACKRMKRRQATEPNQVMNRKNAYNQLRRCFFAVAAASVAALCVVQGLHDVFNISSGSCRSRQYAVDESIKRAGGYQYCE
jgi:hypothetical protein